MSLISPISYHMKRLLIFGLLILTFPAYSQALTDGDRPSVWILGKETIKKKVIDSADYFNFNPKYKLDNADLVYKNIVTNQYSLFVVFKSDTKEETPLLTMRNGNDFTKISNKKTEGIDSRVYQKAVVKKGMMLSYFGSQKIKKGKTNFLSLENIKTGLSKDGHDLMELIYYPRILNKSEKQKIESYLSLKYGISLLGEANYFDSDNNKIWDYKDNSSYGKQITGIGRDDTSGLYQKQSGNSEKDGLYIGYGSIEPTNTLNKTNVPDKEFLVWGSNGNSTSLKGNAKESGVKKMKRTWKIQKSGNTPDSLATEVRIDTKEMLIGVDLEKKNNSKESVWLAISPNNSEGFDYTTASYHEGTYEKEGVLSFKNIYWDNDKNKTDLFTFIKAPDFFVVYDSESPNCNQSDNGKIRLKIIGGEAPYTISLQSKNYSKNFTSLESVIELAELPTDNYKVTVRDNKSRTQSDAVLIESISTDEFSIASEWRLDEKGEVVLFPILENSNEYNYEWFLDDSLISTEKTAKATVAGEYRLVARNTKGCQKNFSMRVLSEEGMQQRNWILYPNPVGVDLPFSIQFNLEDYSDIEISIFTMDGRLVRSKNLYSVKDLAYQDFIGLAGTYVIVVSSNGKSQAVKLVVK